MAAKKKITQDAMQDSFKGLFAGMTPKDSEAPAEPERKASPKKKPEAPAAEDKKPKGKGLTIWISEDEIERLQLYSKITGQKKGDVISAALDAFIKKHPATDEQKKAYQADQKKKQNLAKDI